MACFLHDGLGDVSSYKMTLFHSNFVRDPLKNADFIMNEEKSVWKPSLTLIWLGIEITWKAPSTEYQQKLPAIINSIVLLTEKLPYTAASELAKTSGKVILHKFFRDI